jgi:hypothetical protein
MKKRLKGSLVNHLLQEFIMKGKLIFYKILFRFDNPYFHLFYSKLKPRSSSRNRVNKHKNSDKVGKINQIRHTFIHHICFQKNIKKYKIEVLKSDWNSSEYLFDKILKQIWTIFADFPLWSKPQILNFLFDSRNLKMRSTKISLSNVSKKRRNWFNHHYRLKVKMKIYYPLKMIPIWIRIHQLNYSHNRSMEITPRQEASTSILMTWRMMQSKICPRISK